MTHCVDQKWSVAVLRGGCGPNLVVNFWPSANSTTPLLSSLSSIRCPLGSSTRLRQAPPSLRLHWLASTRKGPAWPGSLLRTMSPSAKGGFPAAGAPAAGAHARPARDSVRTARFRGIRMVLPASIDVVFTLRRRIFWSALENNDHLLVQSAKVLA